MKRKTMSLLNRARVKKQRFLNKSIVEENNVIAEDNNNCDDIALPDNLDIVVKTNHHDSQLKNEHNVDLIGGNQTNQWVIQPKVHNIYSDDSLQSSLHTDYLSSSYLSHDFHDDDTNFSFYSTTDTSQLESGSSMKNKIYKWAVSNVGSVNLRVVTEVLQILRSEGHEDIPSTAQQLLGYSHSVRTTNLATKRNTIGHYFYMGIENGLLNNITPEVFKEKEIKVLVHIDGMKIYKNSQGELWPILLKVYNKKYDSTPFVVGIYYGDSKPADVGLHLHDFVKECQKIIINGVVIKKQKYDFKIFAITGDGQARAYIKCIIGPTGFFCCERCETKGQTVERKRVYPQINANKRTLISFKNKSQQDHHKKDFNTPLKNIPGLNVISDLPIDIMHCLNLNVMKTLLEKLLSPSSPYRVKVIKRKLLRDIMQAVAPYVPDEFQRKNFDTYDLAHWKANQYGFVLFYLGGIVLKDVLPKKTYHHFLLLHAACRILCSSELALDHVDFADEQLKYFFQLMPKFYGESSQTMNFHSLIHLAEDTKYFKVPLSDISAFFGENYIGKLKNFVTSRARPLPQIINRLNAIQKSDNSTIKLIKPIKQYVLKSNEKVYKQNVGNMLVVESLQLSNMILQDVSPNNVVELRTGVIFQVLNILIRNDCANKVEKHLEDFFVEGFSELKRLNAFNTPCPSDNIGICEIGEFSRNLELISLLDIKNKCVFIKIQEKEYAITLLHS